MDTQLTVLLMIVCLAFSFFFSMSETAFFNLQRVRVHHLVASGIPGAQRVARVKERPERFLATVLIGNNLVNTALSALATALAIDLIGSERRGVSILAATAAATIGLVVLGEALPKTLGARHSERLAFLLVRPFELVERVLFPLAALLYGVSRFLTQPFQRATVTRPFISEEELRTMVRLGATEGAVEETQAEIIQNAFRFGSLRAQEIMTPRTAILWAEKGATLGEFLRLYARKPHTRFPVCEGAVDNVAGVMYIRDVVKGLAEGKLREEAPILPLVRPAHFYPESKPVDDLFVEMRDHGIQMAMLVNEHGGIAGLLTMRQIVGQVVGDITEEERESEVQTIDERTVEVDASMRVEEANERLSLGLPQGDYDTVAGFILSALGHVPREGEEVRHNGLRLVVTQMRGVKIQRVLVTRS